MAKKTAVKGVMYNQEKHIRDLKISGSIGGEAVNRGAVLGGTTVLDLIDVFVCDVQLFHSQVRGLLSEWGVSTEGRLLCYHGSHEEEDQIQYVQRHDSS